MGLSAFVRKMGRAVLTAPRARLARRQLQAAYGTIRAEAIRDVAVFPGLGLAYNRIRKNANTSTVILLRQIETGEIEERKAAKWNARRYADLDPDQIRNLAALHLFVIVRNPYSRVLSAFLDKFRHAKFRRRYGDFDLTPEGFGQFLDFLAGGGLSRDRHWDLQTGSMMVPLSKYDSVIRFEDFPEALRDLLRRRGLDVPERALGSLYPSDETKKTGAEGRLAEFYTPERAEAVRLLYRADFATLGYSEMLPAAWSARPHPAPTATGR